MTVWSVFKGRLAVSWSFRQPDGIPDWLTEPLSKMSLELVEYLLALPDSAIHEGRQDVSEAELLVVFLDGLQPAAKFKQAQDGRHLETDRSQDFRGAE
jgi:hypothetical protein